ncbi:MAG TPA: hypothetical protein VJ487_12530 [Alphaproteobacteria bacterium]|nr:hypothetical protein [Alphaproteobacteria bacterium]
MVKRSPASVFSVPTTVCLVIAIAVAALFWRSLASAVAEVIVDIFVAVVRFFVAVVGLFPNPF